MDRLACPENARSGSRSPDVLPFAGRTLLVGRLFLTAFVLDDALTLFRGYAPHKSRGVARRKRFFQRLIDFALAPFNVLWCAHPEGTTHYCICSNFAMCPQKATAASPEPMSALPPKADIDQTIADVRFVPIADMQDVGFVPEHWRSTGHEIAQHPSCLKQGLTPIAQRFKIRGISAARLAPSQNPS